MSVFSRLKKWLKQLAIEKRKGSIDQDAGVIPGQKSANSDTHNSQGKSSWKRRYWLPVFLNGRAYLKSGAVYQVRSTGWRRVHGARMQEAGVA